MTANLRFKKAEKLFEDVPEWQDVKERDRKDIFEDVQHEVAKREKVCGLISFYEWHSCSQQQWLTSYNNQTFLLFDKQNICC